MKCDMFNILELRSFRADISEAGLSKQNLEKARRKYSYLVIHFHYLIFQFLFSHMSSLTRFLSWLPWRLP